MKIPYVLHLLDGLAYYDGEFLLLEARPAGLLCVPTRHREQAGIFAAVPWEAIVGEDWPGNVKGWPAERWERWKRAAKVSLAVWKLCGRPR